MLQSKTSRSNELSTISQTVTVEEGDHPSLPTEVMMIIISQSNNFIGYLRNVFVMEGGSQMLLIVKEQAHL